MYFSPKHYIFYSSLAISVKDVWFSFSFLVVFLCALVFFCILCWLFCCFVHIKYINKNSGAVFNAYTHVVFTEIKTTRRLCAFQNGGKLTLIFTDDAADADDAVERDHERLVPAAVERRPAPVFFFPVVCRQPVRSCLVHFHRQC